MPHRLRHHVEYAAARAGLALFDRLPAQTAQAWALRVGDAAYTLARSRRAIARANLLRSGIAADAAEADRLARGSFRHFALLLAESLKARSELTEATWRHHLVLRIPAPTKELLEQPNQGLIAVSGHVGNWMIAGQLLSFIKPVVAINRPMNNPLTDRLIEQRSLYGHFTTTPKHDANLGRLLGVLKRGDILALLTDQHARSHGVMIDFFGIPAATHSSAAMLHLVSRVPIVFAHCLRTGPMTFVLELSEPIRHVPTGNRPQDVHTILERLNSRLEAAIRQAPEQYLWAHRRWRDAGAGQKAKASPASTLRPGCGTCGKSS